MTRYTLALAVAAPGSGNSCVLSAKSHDPTPVAMLSDNKSQEPAATGDDGGFSGTTTAEMDRPAVEI